MENLALKGVLSINVLEIVKSIFIGSHPVIKMSKCTNYLYSPRGLACCEFRLSKELYSFRISKICDFLPISREFFNYIQIKKNSNCWALFPSIYLRFSGTSSAFDLLFDGGSFHY